MTAADKRSATYRPDEGRAGELVVVDVVHFQAAGIDIAQQEIGFAGNAAEIADARELPIESDRANEGGVGDGVVGDVIDLQAAVRIDYRFAPASPDEAQLFAKELVALHPDVLVGNSTPAAGRCCERRAPFRSYS